MAELWRSEQYLIDPHTAVAVAVARDYRRETGDDTPMLVVSTASPFKFGEAVLDALELPAAEDPVEAAARATGCAVPKPLRGLADKQIRFTDTVEKSAMEQAVRRLLSM